MNTIYETEIFSGWLEKLRDRQAKVRILARIQSAASGNFGDCKSLGGGLAEMRVHYGPGYRVYYGQEGRSIFLLVLGGDKATQKRDVRLAKKLWREIRERKQ